MPWLQFWKRDNETNEPDKKLGEGSDDSPRPSTTSPAPESKTLPPHMQRIVGERRRPADVRVTDPAQRLARMKTQRLAMTFDVDQGELAAQEDNPWSNRIDLLTEAMATVTVDQERLRSFSPSPFHPVPPVPVTNLAISKGSPYTVSFGIDPEAFEYGEDLDWSERGHQLAQPELRRQAGNAEVLVPADTPTALRDELSAHLSHSLDVFASDMRDRQLDGEALPSSVTLADLAPPCPTCGGWADWKGRCASCAVRAAEELRLKHEEKRLLDERAREAEERHRLTERLPIARRRLADLEAEMASLERELQRTGR